MSRARSRAARHQLFDSRATHDEGRKAYMEGRPLHLNPYPQDPQHAGWSGGWLAAFAENPKVGNQTVEKRRCG